MSTPKNNTSVQTTPTAEVAQSASHSERFTNMVMKEFTGSAGPIELSSFQKKLIQNYFIKLDTTLKDAERKRLAKIEKNRDPLPITWENVNMNKLAVDVVAFSSVSLDPLQPNHINLIPYKNTSSNKFDIGFIMGYKGIELKAMKYGFNVPDMVIVELVYANDEFKSIKKSIHNPTENYVFNIVDDFDRGALKGGFYYHSFNDHPEKNKLKVFTMADIYKRKPEYASPEFWGGEKDKWVNGQKAGKETVEGWLDEMSLKTIYRAAYNAITIDSEKIDDHYLKMIELDDKVAESVKREIEENANKEPMDFEDANIINDGQDDQKLLEGKTEDQSEEQPAPETPVAEKQQGNKSQPTLQF